MIIGVDKNQTTGSHGPSNYSKHKQLEGLGHELIVLRVPFGDYIKVDGAVQEVIERLGAENVHKSDLINVVKVSIDTKKNLAELWQNVCQGHERFKRELLKPLSQTDAKLFILIEEAGLTCLEDVYFWQGDAKHHKATKGRALYRSLCTIRDKYNVEFRFCSRQTAGKAIIEILGGGHG